jgi:hypothetical protein
MKNWTPTLALACLSLVPTTPVLAAVFADPPTIPAAPTANTPTQARVLHNSCSGDVPIAVVQTGAVIELRLVDPDCPILPPGPMEQDVALGVLAGGNYDLRLVDVTDAQHPQLMDEAVVNVGAVPCAANALCLQGGRYEITVQWRAHDASTGIGHPIPLTNETGAFWFFADDNYELMVKVHDGCELNNRFWFYAAGLTDVLVTVHVKDTLGGFERTYTNPLGTPFEPVGDTETFQCICEICGS